MHELSFLCTAISCEDSIDELFCFIEIIFNEESRWVVNEEGEEKWDETAWEENEDEWVELGIDTVEGINRAVDFCVCYWWEYSTYVMHDTW